MKLYKNLGASPDKKQVVNDMYSRLESITAHKNNGRSPVIIDSEGQWGAQQFRVRDMGYIFEWAFANYLQLKDAIGS